jgi:glycosyltransferase involved in cell wall biosynthesis
VESPRDRRPPSAPARLVFLLEDLEYGGTQRQALELARRLDPSRFRVELWVLRAGDDLLPLARTWGVPVVWLSRDRWVSPRSLAALWRRLRGEPPDLLMLLTVIPNIWGRVLGRAAGVPRIVGNLRGGGDPWRQHERILRRLADHLLANSRVMKEILVKKYGARPEQVTVIPNGVDMDFFGDLPPAGPPHRRVLLSIGRLVPDKDQATLIKAFHRLSPLHPEAELWLVGRGPRQAALARLAREGGGARWIRFFPPTPDLRPFWRQASIFALSSVREGLPNVVLEAMAAGLPVAATRVGGVPEAVLPGETGLLVPPREVEALAAALDHLLNHPDAAAALGAAGRRRVQHYFSFPAMVQRHETVFRRLLGEV